MAKQRCSATTAKGTPCRAWAVRNSEPPTCAAHRPGTPRVGAPTGNTNAQKHGAYSTAKASTGSLDAVIASLTARLDELSSFIDDNQPDEDGDGLTTELYLAAVQLQGMLSNRIGRLYRDRAELYGEADDLDAAIDAALDVVGGLLGVDL